MCICCGSDKVDKTFIIKDRGWGSKFDLMEIRFPLCNKCSKTKIKKEWFKAPRDYYLYEDDIINFMDEIGIENFKNNIIDRTIVRDV